MIRPASHHFSALHAALPARRTWLKVLHGVMIPGVIWFMIATPDFVRWLWGSQGNAINSKIALLFVTLVAIWAVDYFRRGLAGRPGPKLSPRLKRFHYLLHTALIWMLMLIPVGGLLLGITASRQLWAGGIVPLGVPLSLPKANEVIGTLHIYQFYALGGLALVHAGFHIWRHLRLKDNALRIMAPRILHRFL